MGSTLGVSWEGKIGKGRLGREDWEGKIGMSREQRRTRQPGQPRSSPNAFGLSNGLR